MTRRSYRYSVRLLFATALPLGLMAEGVAPALATSVTVIGTNGSNGASGNLVFAPSGGPGGAATADAGHLIPNSDPSNTATATGGNGGSGGSTTFTCSVFCSHLVGAPGGPGGPATATATTSISTGSATATATATSAGGAGGAGGRRLVYGHSGGNGGNGGAASSSANASNTNGSASATATSTGGNGGPGGLGDFAPNGSAGAVGVGQANASAEGGVGTTPRTAVAKSDAKNSQGEAVTTASAPGGGVRTSPSALTLAGVGSGTVALATAFTRGQVVSDAVLTGPATGEGAMSAAYGGRGDLEYTATAVFDFTTTAESEALDLTVLSDKVAGIGFDSLELLVTDLVDSTTTTLLSKTFSSLTGSSGAENFFAPGHSIALGPIAAGSQSIEIEYLLSYKTGTLATSPAGFGFTYDLADPPGRSPGTVPEPSTWAMMLIGFAGLAYAGMRRSYGLARRRIRFIA